MFAAATQGFFLVRNRMWETAVLLLITFTLFRPDIYRDWFYAPYRVVPLEKVQEVIEQLKVDENMRLRIEVEEKTKSGKIEVSQRTFVLPVSKGTAEGRLKRAGLELDAAAKEGKWDIVDIGVDSKAERARLDVGNKNRLLGIEVRNPQPGKEWFALPAFLLLAVVVISQRRRITKKP